MSQVSRETIAAATRDLALPAQCIDQLTHHWDLLLEWNARTNLTAITDLEQAAWLHYRDSLEALAVLPSGGVTDIGSGGGFPGIPIAVAEPERPVHLVEPRRKRASFLAVVVSRLGLNNVKISTARAEDQPEPTDAVVTRATFSDAKELGQCLRWVAPGGRLIAFRSDPAEIPHDSIHWYELKGDRRCLLIWQKQPQRPRTSQ